MVLRMFFLFSSFSIVTSKLSAEDSSSQGEIPGPSRQAPLTTHQRRTTTQAETTATYRNEKVKIPRRDGVFTCVRCPYSTHDSGQMLASPIFCFSPFRQFTYFCRNMRRSAMIQIQPRPSIRLQRWFDKLHRIRVQRPKSLPSPF
jgi:hypothetical protein